MTGTALRTTATVGPGGRVELELSLPPGTSVEVFVFVPATEDDADLVAAATSALEFWDNPLDDEDWNATESR